MASVKIICKSKIYKNNKSPVGIRFIIDRKDYFITVTSVEQKNWDSKKSEVKAKDPDRVQKNKLLLQKLREAEDYLIECELNGLSPSFEGFKKRKSGQTLLLTYLNDYIDKLNQDGKFRSADKYKVLLNKIKSYDSTGITWSTIDKLWISGFEKHLYGYDSKKNISPNTVEKHLANLRALFNKAIDDGLTKSNPFDHIKLKRVKTYKEKLTKPEIQALEIFSPESSKHQLALYTFLLAVYLRGIRCADLLLLKKDSIIDGRLYYTEGKTHKAKSLKLESKALEIIKRYQDASNNYLLPWVPDWVDLQHSDMKMRKKSLRKINSINSNINNMLKHISKAAFINKNISMHTARHSFALAMIKAGKDLSTLQNALNHSSIKVTEDYTRDLMKDEDLDNEVSGLFD